MKTHKKRKIYKRCRREKRIYVCDKCMHTSVLLDFDSRRNSALQKRRTVSLPMYKHTRTHFSSQTKCYRRRFPPGATNLY